jgi:hypothetical protein
VRLQLEVLLIGGNRFVVVVEVIVVNADIEIVGRCPWISES